MGANSHIEWCDHTFNPWEGCTKVSPGCAHCYAEARDVRFTGGKHWGKGAPRRRTSVSNWNEPRRWNRAVNDVWEKHGCSKPGCGFPDGRPCIGCGLVVTRPRVFCASLADWLDDEVPIEWLADLLDLIRRTPNLDWLLLTKRPENWKRRMDEAFAHKHIYGTSGQDPKYLTSVMVDEWREGRPPPNVWIGTTVEDQQRADERIPLLLSIPARVRFLSCEPLLGPVDLLAGFDGPQALPLGRGINWVICGGESGKDARPMHPDWARTLRDQCRDFEVPFFFKQWGEWFPADQYTYAHTKLHEKAQHTFDADTHSFWVGKLGAGRLLDGKEHSEFPS